MTVAAWDSPAGAWAAYYDLLVNAPSLRHRQVLAELVRLVPAGRIVVNRDDRRWLAWLNTGDLIPDGRDFPEVRAHLAQLAHSVRWLADGGVVVETPATVPTQPATATANPALTGWQGATATDELLIPQDLTAGDVIDLAGIAALGTWTYDWFRAHPGQGLVGARPEIRRQLEHAQLPILWRDPRHAGVTAAEKAELFG